MPKKPVREAILIILAVAGALGIIALRPQILITAKHPLSNSDAFSVPFQIENTGYLSFFVSDVFVFVHKADFPRHVLHSDNISNSRSWNDFTLNRGEAKTIEQEIVKGIPNKADILVAVDYKPESWFPVSFRKYFRFVFVHRQDWTWYKEPSSDLQSEADPKINAFLRFMHKKKFF